MSKKFEREYPIKELREKTPTMELRWSKSGDLEQKWIYHYAIWDNVNSTKWWHDYESVWVKVPNQTEMELIAK